MLATQTFGVVLRAGPLALTTFKADSGGGLITRAAVEQLGGEDKKQFFSHLVPGYFVVQSGGDYLFPSDTLREFFAAQAIAGMVDPFAGVRGHLHDPKWQQVILYVAGSLEKLAAAKIDLKIPTLTHLFVKFISPFLKVVAAVAGVSLEPVSKPAGTAVKVTVEELGKLGRSPLQTWLADSASGR